ncbi:carbohydrate ABC transporter permease [Rhizobium mongolense]|uniref:ABC-type sugar transport system permease subunit n=1 Tax=Rhizobium mongolense TaxID=57676 RepID=A0A7W6RSD2_9HYPH|nr:sugar ABC transporter permease [Rhizobium mongolense]MBB4277722.1 ABC-type sugar transport system permease subunit [Rhizobium mongolense]
MERSVATKRRGDPSRVALLLLAPAIMVMVLLLALPVLLSIALSFTDATLSAGALNTTFSGFSNYVELLWDKSVWRAVLNTLYFAVVEVLGVLVLGMLAALLLNNPRSRWSGFRVLLLLPWAIAPVASAVLWKWILHANYGVLNQLLKWIGVIDENVMWLGEGFRALNVIVAVDVWKSTPFITILLLAALQGIPSSLYRAARMDGASAWDRFRYITLPSLRTAIAIAVVLQTIWSLRAFDLIYILTKGGPADGTVVMNFHAYRVTFNFLKFGYGAAIANVLFIATFLLAAVYIRLMKVGEHR